MTSSGRSTDITRVLGVLCAAGLAGLMTTLLVVMRPMWREEDDLAAAGVFLAGFFVVTGVINVPVYREVQSWDLARDPDTAAARVRARLARFDKGNAVRLVATVTSATLYAVG